MLYDKPSGCTLNLDPELGVDDDSDNKESLTMSSATTCNFVSGIEQYSNIPTDDVVFFSSTQSDSLKGDAALIVTASFVAQLTEPYKTKKVEILEDKVNYVAEDLRPLVSYVPPANWTTTAEPECISHSMFFHVIIYDLPHNFSTCLCYLLTTL